MIARRKHARVFNISIHALRGEGDTRRSPRRAIALSFQSTPSVGRATFIYSASSKYIPTFQSTPSVGRATLTHSSILRAITDISIHALRGEGDTFAKYQPMRCIISIHALRGEGDGRL